MTSRYSDILKQTKKVKVTSSKDEKKQIGDTIARDYA
jgi:hypothetical protein